MGVIGTNLANELGHHQPCHGAVKISTSLWDGDPGDAEDPGDRWHSAHSSALSRRRRGMANHGKKTNLEANDGIIVGYIYIDISLIFG